MSYYDNYDYMPRSQSGSGGKIALFVIIIFLLIALFALIVDTYFYPFITGQMYGGECKKTEDCRQGLACSPDARNPAVSICQEATTGNIANQENCKTFCNCPEVTVASCTTKFPNLKST